MFTWPLISEEFKNLTARKGKITVKILKDPINVSTDLFIFLQHENPRWDQTH